MTGLQIAMAGGTLIGLALALVAWRLAPSDPDLVDALDHLSPSHAVGRGGGTPVDGAESMGASEFRERMGLWALGNLPAGVWTRTPHRHLAILRMSEARFYGEKLVWSLLGLALPPLLATFFWLIGLPLPVAIPTIGSLVLAGAFWFMPNYNVADDARRARVEFDRALGAYIELVALERRSGASGQQALATAAEVGDSWVFRRLEGELRRARYMSRAPWDSLHALSDELGVPGLDDLADIMQQSGQDGAQIYSNLRARAAALRSAMLSAEIGNANAASERMYIPASLLGVVFMAILVAPSLLRFTT